MKSLLIIEKDSPKFILFNPFSGKIIAEVNTIYSKIKAHKTPIISAEYIPD